MKNDENIKENMIVEGSAHYSGTMEAQDGTLVLTSKSLIFRDKNMNNLFSLDLKDIEEVSVVKLFLLLESGLKIKANGHINKVKVAFASEWSKVINKQKEIVNNMLSGV